MGAYYLKGDEVLGNRLAWSHVKVVGAPVETWASLPWHSTLASDISPPFALLQVQNDNKPLWTRSPKEVQKEEYDQFYKTTFR